MKRFLCVLFAAVFAVTLGFAQELKLDGYINSGLGLIIDNDSGNEVKLVVMGVDSEQFAGRFRLNGAYTNADKNIGANFRLQYQGNNPSSGFAPSFVYGWVKFFDMLQFKAGLVDDAVWETGGAILKDDQGEGAGVLARLTPVAGLDIGLGAFAWSPSGGSGNNSYATPGKLQNWNDVKYTAMVSYTLPDVFKINLSGRTFNASGNNSARVLAEFRLLAVKGLTAIVELEMDNLYNRADHFNYFTTDGKVNIFETFAYKIDSLNFGLNAAQYISNAAAADMVGIRFNPWISYALLDGKLVPRLDGVFFLAGEWKSAQNYDRRADLAATNKKGTYVFNVRPSLKINVDSRNSFEIGDVMYYEKATGGKTFSNVFYLDYVFRF